MYRQVHMNKKKIIKETVKKHIPQRHLASVRIMYRIAMETVYGIKRTGLINIAIVAAMAAILTIFGALFRTSFSLSTFVDKLGNDFQISVYLKPSTDPVYMSSRLKEIEHVKKISIITKEEAWIRKKLRENPGLTRQQLKNTVGMFSNKNPKKVMTEKGLNQKQYKDRYDFLGRVYQILDQ